jgi:hypothetical protein
MSHVDLPQWVESEEERPIAGPWLIWGGGVLAPALIAVYGLACILGQEAILLGPRGGMMVYGIDAAAVGCAVIALAGMLHFFCFWDSRFDSTRQGARGKFCCLCVMGACAYFLCFRLMLGWA